MEPKDLAPEGEEVVNNVWDAKNIIAAFSGQPLSTREMSGKENGSPYFYEIGYSTCEDSGYIQLIHEEFYTSEEFRQMIIQATIPVAKKKFEGEKTGRYPVRLTFDTLYELVAQALCETFGFRKVTFSARYSLFGWADLRETESASGWKCGDEDLSKAIIEVCGTLENER